MVIPIKEAVIKYKDYLVAVDETKKLLEHEGFQVIPSDNFELGAEWTVIYNDTPVAEVMWNVPYMLSFKHRIPQRGIEFESDLVSGVKEWRESLKDIARSIIDTKTNGNIYDKVVPRLNETLFFKENSFKNATEPVREGDGWYIQGQFFVKDELTYKYNKTKPFYRRRRGNKDGDLGHAFPFIMCNKAYLGKHEKELKADGYKPIIMEKFDTESATKLLADKIKDAGDYVSIDTLWEHLSLFADTEYDS